MRHLNYALMLDKAVPRVRLSVARAYALTGQTEAAFSQLHGEGFGVGFDYVRWVVLARFLGWLDRYLLNYEEITRPAIAIQRERVLPLADLVIDAANAGLDEIVEWLVPELQERGAYRTAYTATTLRGHLGLRPPLTRRAPVGVAR